LPSLALDVALIIAVYAATVALASADDDAAPPARALALIAAAVIAIHPAVVYDSAVWAQTDAAVTVAMLASILLAWRRRPVLAWVAWTLGFLIKPHPVIVLPVLIIVTVRASGWRACPPVVGAVCAVAAIVLGPWVVHGDAVRIIEIYRSLFWADYA